MSLVLLAKEDHTKETRCSSSAELSLEDNSACKSLSNLSISSTMSFRAWTFSGKAVNTLLLSKITASAAVRVAHTYNRAPQQKALTRLPIDSEPGSTPGDVLQTRCMHE